MVLKILCVRMYSAILSIPEKFWKVNICVLGGL